MSVNNRKYITSTGMLLKQLNEESKLNNNSYQNHQHQTQNQMYQQSSGTNYHSQNLGSSMNQYNQTPYSNSNMPNYSTGHMSNQFSTGLFNNSQNGLPVVAAAAAIFSKLAASSNQFQHQSNVPDIMMLPGSMSQQRWQHQSKPSSHPYFKQQKHQNLNKKNNSLNSSTSVSSMNAVSSSSSSSSVIELPETFGLPSNKVSKTSHSKYASSATSLQSSSSATTMESLKSQTDILIEDKSNETTESKSDDIEIISENYPSIDMNSQVTANTTASNSMMIQTAFQSNNDENFKNYLAKNYDGGQLAIATKPQCNFISNLSCINQILNECDYYNKLKRRKPYSNIRLNKIFNDSEEDESDQDDDDKPDSTRVKSKKIIVIDDTNEELHKPWITPDLIKLIKHRNLLQSKINENKLEANTNLSDADAELMKKFKNLRNKVTKLVKKARKDYLVKYIQESKENKTASTEKTTNNELESELISDLAKNPVPPPPTTSTTTTTSAKSPTGSTVATVETNKTNPNINPTILSLTTQLNSSTNQTTFLQNQNNLMMSLYNSYFNQYLQQYQHQQQQAQQLATAAAAKTDEAAPKSETETGYDMLQKQAAYYAQQQRAIQTQLETSLSQSAQQLVQEMAQMASNKPNQQPAFILNQQFNNQQQHHLHQHIHPGSNQQQNYPQPQSNQIGLLVPNQAAAGIVAQPQSNKLYSMQYNYKNNMIVS